MDAPVPTPQALTCSQLMLSVGTTCGGSTHEPPCMAESSSRLYTGWSPPKELRHVLGSTHKSVATCTSTIMSSCRVVCTLSWKRGAKVSAGEGAGGGAGGRNLQVAREVGLVARASEVGERRKVRVPEVELVD